MKQIYRIEGMHCASCANNIEKSVKKISAIKTAVVNFATKKLYIEAEKIDEEEIKKAVSKIGDYKAFKEEYTIENNNEEKLTTFYIKGLDNPHCAMTIENAIKRLDGIKKIDLNTNTHKAIIKHTISKQEIIKAINQAGYEVLKEKETEEESEIKEMNTARKRMWYAWH